jgi:hypothetical protein
MVVVSPTAKWTKMQCPKCRAVIAFPSPGMAGPSLEAGPRGEPAGQAPGDPEAAHLETRLSTLEARLVSLEQELTTLKSLKAAQADQNRQAETGDRKSETRPFPSGASGPAPTPKGLAETGNRELERPPCGPHQETFGVDRADQIAGPWARQEFLPAKAREGFPEKAERPRKAEESETTPESSRTNGARRLDRALKEQRLKAPLEERMVQKLAEITAGEVAIRVKEGDTEAILFGEWLGLTFIKAGWTVTKFEARPLPPEDRNLSLAISGNFPFPKRASTIHRALAVAGLELVFGIDSTSDSPVPTLVVPRRPVEESGDAEVDAPRSLPDAKWLEIRRGAAPNPLIFEHRTPDTFPLPCSLEFRER